MDKGESDRELEHKFLARVVRFTIGRNDGRTCSNLVVDELERWTDVVNRRAKFIEVRKILGEMVASGELEGELAPPPGQGIARRWFRPSGS